MNVLDKQRLWKLPTGAPAHAATYAFARSASLANWNSYPLRAKAASTTCLCAQRCSPAKRSTQVGGTNENWNKLIKHLNKTDRRKSLYSVLKQHRARKWCVRSCAKLCRSWIGQVCKGCIWHVQRIINRWQSTHATNSALHKRAQVNASRHIFGFGATYAQAKWWNSAINNTRFFGCSPKFETLCGRLFDHPNYIAQEMPMSAHQRTQIVRPLAMADSNLFTMALRHNLNKHVCKYALPVRIQHKQFSQILEQAQQVNGSSKSS